MSPERKLMRSPRVVNLNITSRCNLTCRYCYSWTTSPDCEADLPSDEWIRFIHELGESAVMKVIIGGGEPFLRTDLPDLVDAIVKNHMRFSILSNGTKITRKLAQKIGESKRCDHVQISIDGATPDVHDRSRGNGSFQGAIQGIQILKSEGIPVISRVTLTRQNFHDIENIFHLLLSELGLSSVSVSTALQLGKIRSGDYDVQLTQAEYKRAVERLVVLERQYSKSAMIRSGPLLSGLHFQKMEEARCNGSVKPGGGFLTGCGCMWRKLSVRPDGVIIPCNLLSTMGLGRINETGFLDIWSNHPDLIRLRNRELIPLAQFPICAECPWRMACDGNCPGNGYHRTGDVYSPSPVGCLKKFIEDGGTIIPITN